MKLPYSKFYTKYQQMERNILNNMEFLFYAFLLGLIPALIAQSRRNVLFYCGGSTGL